MYFIHIVVFLSLITPIAFLWIMFGTVLISNKVTWLNQRNLQRTAAFILTFFNKVVDEEKIILREFYQRIFGEEI